MTRLGRVVLRIMISHATPKLNSISSIFHGAEWHERETTDFYGISLT
jgi:NADH-quinone oxidoreductase subunit C